MEDKDNKSEKNVKYYASKYKSLGKKKRKGFNGRKEDILVAKIFPDGCIDKDKLYTFCLSKTVASMIIH